MAILSRLTVSPAGGLLVGGERGWQTRDAEDNRRAAGRTFALSGLLAAAMLAAEPVRRIFGGWRLVAAALSGVVAVTMTMVRMAVGDVDPKTATPTIMIAIAVNMAA